MDVQVLLAVGISLAIVGVLAYYLWPRKEKSLAPESREGIDFLAKTYPTQPPPGLAPLLVFPTPPGSTPALRAMRATRPDPYFQVPSPPPVQNSDDGFANLATEIALGSLIVSAMDNTPPPAFDTDPGPDYSATDPAPDFSGQGGTFGGAGASGSWDDPQPQPDPTPEPETPSYDPPTPDPDPPSYDAPDTSSDNSYSSDN